MLQPVTWEIIIGAVLLAIVFGLIAFGIHHRRNR